MCILALATRCEREAYGTSTDEHSGQALKEIDSMYDGVGLRTPGSDADGDAWQPLPDALPSPSHLPRSTATGAATVVIPAASPEDTESDVAVAAAAGGRVVPGDAFAGVAEAPPADPVAAAFFRPAPSPRAPAEMGGAVVESYEDAANITVSAAFSFGGGP